MIVDTSAIIAILRLEPDAATYAAAIQASSVCRVSTVSLVEVGIVLIRLGHPNPNAAIDRFLGDSFMEPVPFSLVHARLAQSAYRAFGRNSGSPARLNSGDCCTYALAKDLDEPLLFKGDNFIHTDVQAALPRSRTATPADLDVPR